MNSDNGGNTSGDRGTVFDGDWKRYHAAWQKYYQEYYGKYYLNAAREYIARESEKLRTSTPNVATETTSTSGTISNDTLNDTPKVRLNFKHRIQTLTSEKHAKLEKRRKILPFLAGALTVLFLLFLQYNRLIFAPLYAYVSPGTTPATEITAVDPTVTLTNVSSENKLIIPKLNVDVPVIYGVDFNDVMDAMNRGVSHYRINGASAYPGEIGNFVITGHSAGDIYSSNPYKFIFSGLERLVEGDLLYIHYNGTRYTYQMTQREIIDPTEVEKLIYPTEKPVMTLVTCYPLGTSRQRLLITAEQISPSPDSALASPSLDTSTTTTPEIPKNEKTFGEKVLDFLGW